MKHSVSFLLPLVLSLFLAACSSTSQTEPLPGSPLPTPVGVLNLVAVGIAIAGGLLGLILAMRRRDSGGDSEPADTHTQTRRKKGR